MIKVSVIVPVYKVPLKYLRECFASLLAQTMQESEFIVVSDGAPDAECSVCEEYAAKDPRLKFFRREHAGVSATRNFGIEQALGEYITFVDSDDSIKSNFCKDLHTFAKENESDVVLFDFDPVGNQFQKTSYAESSAKKLSSKEIEEICKQCICLTNDRFVGAVSTICKLTKKTIIKQNNIEFSPNITIAEDRPFSFSIFSCAKKISYLHSCLYNYNLNNSSATHKIKNRSFPNISAHLLKIHDLTNKYDDLVCSCIVQHFFGSWQTYYFSKDNEANIISNILELSKIVHSRKFKYFFDNVQLKEFPFHVQFEIQLIRRRITFLIWLHGLKFSLSRLL